MLRSFGLPDLSSPRFSTLRGVLDKAAKVAVPMPKIGDELKPTFDRLRLDGNMKIERIV